MTQVEPTTAKQHALILRSDYIVVVQDMVANPNLVLA